MAMAEAEAETEADCDAAAQITPDTFDVIIYGTGLVEAVLAAAAAQAGLSVLHLDPKPRYGGADTSLNLREFLSWARDDSGQAPDADPAPDSPGSDGLVYVDNNCSPFSNKVVELDGSDEDLGDWRRYLIDLSGPRAIFAGGHLVNTLLKSNAQHYMEFKAIESVEVVREQSLEKVPGSRSEVFRTDILDPREKRLLFRFVQRCVDDVLGPEAEAARADIVNRRTPELGADHPDRQLDGEVSSFGNALDSSGMDARLKEVVSCALALADDPYQMSQRRGFESIARFATSVGRFGSNHSALLFPLYSNGEVPQAFCRLAAVKGAVYALNTPIRSIQVSRAESESEDAAAAVRGEVETSRNQKLGFRKALFLNSLYYASMRSNAEERRTTRRVARLVSILDRPISTNSQSSVRDYLRFFVIPPQSQWLGNSNVVRGLQAGPGAYVCPNDRCLLYLSMQVDSPDTDPQDAYGILDRAVRHLVQLGQLSEEDHHGEGQGENGHSSGNGVRESAQILCKVFYVHTIHSFEDENAEENGIHCCSDCSLSSDYTDVIEAAQVLVKRAIGQPWFPQQQPSLQRDSRGDGDGEGDGDDSNKGDSADPDASADAYAGEQESSQGMTNTRNIEEDSDDEDLSFLREALGSDAP